MAESRGAGPGGYRTLFTRERSNYPLNVSVSDTGTRFFLIVEALAPPTTGLNAAGLAAEREVAKFDLDLGLE